MNKYQLVCVQYLWLYTHVLVLLELCSHTANRLYVAILIFVNCRYICPYHSNSKGLQYVHSIVHHRTLPEEPLFQKVHHSALDNVMLKEVEGHQHWTGGHCSWLVDAWEELDHHTEDTHHTLSILSTRIINSYIYNSWLFRQNGHWQWWKILSVSKQLIGVKRRCRSTKFLTPYIWQCV